MSTSDFRPIMRSSCSWTKPTLQTARRPWPAAVDSGYEWPSPCALAHLTPTTGMPLWSRLPAWHRPRGNRLASVWEKSGQKRGPLLELLKSAQTSQLKTDFRCFHPIVFYDHPKLFFCLFFFFKKKSWRRCSWGERSHHFGCRAVGLSNPQDPNPLQLKTRR